jgi:hypothetical protein
MRFAVKVDDVIWLVGDPNVGLPSDLVKAVPKFTAACGCRDEHQFQAKTPQSPPQLGAARRIQETAGADHLNKKHAAQFPLKKNDVGQIDPLWKRKLQQISAGMAEPDEPRTLFADP